MFETTTAVVDESVALLTAKAAAGDGPAREHFSQRYLPMVQRWLAYRWRLSPFRGFVDDAAQDVFLECFRPDGALAHVDCLGAGHDVEGYLRGVVRNVALRVERNEARLHRHRSALAEDPAQVRHVAPDAATQLDRKWATERIRAALVLVEGADRHPPAGHSLCELLQLLFERNMTVRAIASAWHEKAAHVHEMRRRACGLFRACFLQVCRATKTAPAVDTGREVLCLLE